MKSNFININSGLISLVMLLIFTVASCKKDDEESLPTVVTVGVSEITSGTAKVNFSVTDDGGTTVTAAGICWSKTFNPDLNANVSNVGQGTGNFISIMTGLGPNTTYHVRSYATNNKGTSYGNDLAFTTLN